MKVTVADLDGMIERAKANGRSASYIAALLTRRQRLLEGRRTWQPTMTAQQREEKRAREVEQAAARARVREAARTERVRERRRELLTRLDNGELETWLVGVLDFWQVDGFDLLARAAKGGDKDALKTMAQLSSLLVRWDLSRRQVERQGPRRPARVAVAEAGGSEDTGDDGPNVYRRPWPEAGKTS